MRAGKWFIIAGLLSALAGSVAYAAPPIYNGTANLYATSTSTPLVVTGSSGQSVDLFDVLLFGGTSVFAIGSTGTTTLAGLNIPTLAPSTAVCTDGSSNISTTSCPTFTGVSSITAGSNIVVTGTASVPIVAVTAAPTFTGTITDSNATPLALSGTGNNTITSAATGASVGFILNNTGAATALLLSMQNAGTAEWKVTGGGTTTQNGSLVMNGSITGATSLQIGGAFTGATTGAFSNILTLSGGFTNNITMSGTNSNGMTSATGATATAFTFGAGTSRSTGALAQFINSATTVAQLGANSNAGTFEVAPTINSTTVLGPVAPAYTAAGGSEPSTYHTVFGTCIFAASTSCTPAAFTNSGAFQTATTYACSASGGAGTFAQTGALSVGSQSATGIIITAAVSNSQTVTYICTGA